MTNSFIILLSDLYPNDFYRGRTDYIHFLTSLYLQILLTTYLMNRKSFIVIHKREWDRIKRREIIDNTSNEREKYFQTLIEKSQEMISNWHDSVQGHINKVERQKKLKLAKDLQMIRDFRAKKKLGNNDEVIIKAKELIFQDSCYGRQLMSALFQSKVLEEREAQIKFQRKIREKFDKENELKSKATSLIFPDENQIKLNKRRMEKEVADVNKAMYETKKIYERKKRTEERQKTENESLIKQIIENEAKLQTELLLRHKNEIKEYERQNIELRESRANIEKQEELLREIWRKYQDRIKWKEKIVFDKIHRDSSLKTQMANTYKIIEKSNNEKDKKYNDFVESGVAKDIERLNEEEQRECESKGNEHKKRKELEEENKILLEFKKQLDLNNDMRYNFGQSPETQHFPKFKEKQKLKTDKYLAKRTVDPSFLVRSNKLIEKQKKLRNETPWNGLKGAHRQFEEHANEVLQQCRYKFMALKVIKDYQKTNCLDEKSQPISE